MNKAIDANNIRPVIDDQVFDFEHAKEAYTYMIEARYFGVFFRLRDSLRLRLIAVACLWKVVIGI